MPEFEKAEGCNTHEILSDNVLCCAETGRVVAVFYNGYDLDNVLNKMKNKEPMSEADFLKNHVCEMNRAFDGATCLVCNEQIS